MIPATEIGPLSVMSPPIVTLRFAEMVEAARVRALVSLRVTLLAEETETEEKLFAGLLSVMSLVEPALKFAAPVTVRIPDCVMAPLVLTVSAPLMVEAARTRELASPSETLLAAEMETEEKSLKELSRVMLLVAPALKSEAPTTDMIPD